VSITQKSQQRFSENCGCLELKNFAGDDFTIRNRLQQEFIFGDISIFHVNDFFWVQLLVLERIVRGDRSEGKNQTNICKVSVTSL
jgi:hypothetical protein